MNFSELLGPALLTCLGICAGERKVVLLLNAQDLGDFVDTVQYLLSYVSNSNRI